MIRNTIDIPERYALMDLVGRGGFGEVYRVKDTQDGSIKVCKVEACVEKDKGVLNYESRILFYLRGVLGVPMAFDSGEKSSFRYLIMQYCGYPLDGIHKVCSYKFDMKTTLVIGLRVLDILEGVHGKYILHRDLKPENLMFDPSRGQFFLIDFGLSKRFIDRAGNHIPRNVNKAFRGTLRYCSINMHNGVENSRRDDIESLSYLLVYLHKGTLPWIRSAVGLLC